MSEKTEPRIAWSSDNEEFSFDTLGELIDAQAPEVGTVVYFGECVPPRIVYVDADDVIEMIGDRAYDEGGDHAEGFPDVSSEAKSELDAFLRAWQENHCNPTWWGITDAKEYTITPEDLA